MVVEIETAKRKVEGLAKNMTILEEKKRKQEFGKYHIGQFWVF